MTSSETTPVEWGRRWQASLAPVQASARRTLDRARGLVRRGRLFQVQMGPGVLAARVTDDRAEQHDVVIRIATFDGDEWDQIGRRAAGSVRHTATLLAHEVSDEFDRLVGDVTGRGLVPATEELEPTCSCGAAPDCVHVHALLALAEARVGGDPSLLLRLRGRSPDELASTVRWARKADAPILETVPDDPWRASGDPTTIRVHPEPPSNPSVLIDHLGPPPGIDDPETITTVVARAAAMAWRLAAGEGSDEADRATLLAELRARGVVSVSQLADSLGRPSTEVADELEELFAAGAVLRTGAGDRLRYRAAD